MSVVTFSLSDRRDGRWLELAGGDPKGRDSIHTLVSSWPGWRRCPQLGSHNGQPCSRYQARAWLSALQPLLASDLKIHWTAEAKAWASSETQRFQRRLSQLEAKVEPGEAESFVMGSSGRHPMPHQVQMLRALIGTNEALVTDDMGLGKTATSLFRWGHSPCRRALVVCPKSVKLNWVDEINLAFTPSLPLVYLIDGTPHSRANVIGYMRAALTEERRAIAIVNYDLLRSMNAQAWTTLEAWCSQQCVIADEFHYCKDRDSKRSTAVQALMALAQLRLGLTGTPVRNTVEDLFSQVEILRPGTWVSYHDFANRHLVITQAQFNGNKRKTNIVRGGKNLNALAEITNTLFLGRKKEDVLTLPPMIRTKPMLELDGLHLDVYKQMKDFARVELEKLLEPTGEIGEGLTMFHPLARSAVEAAMRCEMIAQGFISGLPEQYAEQIAPLIVGHAERVLAYPNAFVFPASPKMAWLLDVVENDLKDRPVVIYSRFNAPILWLKERLDGCMLIGSMDAVARQESIQAFKRGEKRVMLVQVKLAEGFNLTNATDEIFLGRDWSPAINFQAEARCHRIGTQGTVNVQIPIVTNSVEKFIDKKLAAKDADAQQALAKVTLRELLEAL